MRARFVGGLVCLMLGAVCAHGGGAAKEPPFEEASFEAVQVLLGNWQATVETKNGWRGTLQGQVKAQRTGPEGSIFHALLDVRYQLVRDDKKKPVIATGTEEIALLPYEKGKHRYVQCLREFQVMQREQAEEVLEIRSTDKEARRIRAALRPTAHNTALYRINSKTWILTVSPGLLAMLPRQAPDGPAIDWSDEIVWTRVKKK
jgi:hypothetical protein